MKKITLVSLLQAVRARIIVILTSLKFYAKWDGIMSSIEIRVFQCRIENPTAEKFPTLHD